MAEKAKDTQAEADKAAAEAKAAADKAVADAEANKGKTIAEITKENTPPAESTAQQTVGLDKFLELKKENKEFKKQLKDLEKSIEEGASKVEVTEDIEAIADEFGVDVKFLSKLTKAIKSQAEKDADERVSNRLKPLEAKEKQAKIDEAFKTHFKIAIDAMPEFAKIVNPEVIKTLSLDPKNANKTFAQIIEETYGGALTGKSTIEATKPGGGKDPEPLDFAKARKDSKYFDEVMANPTLKKEYNERMLKEGF